MDDASTMLRFEIGLRREGFRCIVGIDEVGRGALAGPLAAATVVLPDDLAPAAGLWAAVRDSKVLDAVTRSELAAGIALHARAFATATVDAPVIDAIGISAANRLAMETALDALPADVEPDVLLIDAMTIDSPLPQHGIIDGDALSLSIAAASIVAKVHRDTLMIALDAAWPAYGWARNKGYGVPSHRAALLASGPCEHHRASFRPVAECLNRD